MCSTMASTTEMEDKPAYDVLARKTVEILDVANSTRQLLIEQYSNDQTKWMEAMFRILMWKNQAFLQDERNSSVRDPNVHKIMRDLILEMFHATDEQNPLSDSILRDQLLETGCNLISTFRIFTNFLLQSKLDVADELANLQYIAKNIDKYVQKHVDKSEKAKSAEREKVKSVNEPEKAKSLDEPQKMKIANETDPGSLANEVKPVANEAPKVKPASNEPQETKNTSEPQKVKPICNNHTETRVFTSYPLVKAPIVKRNKNEETFGSEAIALARNASAVVSDRRSATPTCEVCNDPITVYNGDEKFSLSLHEADTKHKKAAAAKKKMYAAKEASPVEFKDGKLCADNATARKIIVDLVGEVQARFFRVEAGDEFFCMACKCSVYSTYNVVTHVQGRNHKRNSGFKSQESKESRSGSDSRDLTSDEVDSAEDEVFRCGSAVPVESLF